MNTTDLIGKKFGKLIVIRFDHIEHKRDKNGKNRDKGFWLCKCDCGNEVTVSRNVLVTGDKKSCGCLHKEMLKKNARNKVIDLTGKRINKLFVMGLEKIECKKTKNGENQNRIENTIILKIREVKNESDFRKAGKQIASH